MWTTIASRFSFAAHGRGRLVSPRARRARLRSQWSRYWQASFASGNSKRPTPADGLGVRQYPAKGQASPLANMLVEDYLRPAAVKAGVLKEGEKIRFGFHNLRHSLASFLVRKGTDAKTVQAILRHSDVTTTLGIYAHSMSKDRLAAQDDMLAAMMTTSNAVN